MMAYTINLQEVYKKKKCDFAQTVSPYRDLYGEHCGYTFAPVVHKETIIEFENKYNVKIPDDLLQYFTCVSREIFITRYPHVVDFRLFCEEDIPDSEKGKCIIDEEFSYVIDYKGFLQIGCNGEFQQYVLVDPTSIWFGSVWETSPHTIHKVSDSFTIHLANDLRSGIKHGIYLI